MKKTLALSLLCFSLLMSACSSSDVRPDSPPADSIAFSPSYSPTIGLVPFPNDLFFAGTTDGTLNIPAGVSLLNLDAMNALDGYSVNAPINLLFNAAIDGSTLIGGATAHLFEVISDPATKATIGFVGALVPGLDYQIGVSSATNGANVAEFKLLKPLKPKSTYLVALTNGVNSSAGTAAAASTVYQQIKDALATGQTLSDPTLDQIKQLIGAHLAILGAIGIPASDVLVSSSFTTQSTTDVLAAVAANAGRQGSAIQQVFAAPGVPLSTNLISPALPGYANVYAGTVDTPYFLSKASPVGETAIPWQGVGGSNLTQYNPLAVATETLSIPALVTVPNATSPWYQGFVAQSGGITPEQAGYKWPLIIFQHGITGNRTNALGIVDAYASAGFAVISIDQPLHGVTDPSNIFYTMGAERTFDLDLDANGTIDSSGTYFINLANLLVGRDNLRQASMDLHYLSKTAPTIDISGDGVPDFDGTKMHFIGMSLGSIVGTPFLAINTDVITGTLNVPGGGMTNLLRESGSFAPVINAGLEAQGLTVNSFLYNEFLRNAQTVIDSGDPLSFAADAATNHPILVQKVIGDNVIPNSATDNLIAALGLPAANQLGINPGPLGAVTFTSGVHSSLLLPSPLATLIEMQTEAVVFAGGNPLAGIPANGQVILIQDASVVEIAP